MADRDFILALTDEERDAVLYACQDIGEVYAQIDEDETDAAYIRSRGQLLLGLIPRLWT
jgi:hypothetical protein